ncbi:hypothetical protein ARMSODRAFT_805682 [Armillaria solidipes]|uniref:Uncharacterized protein n=1 Tax=Armillaria solidipes TaxID=1076256 RepID=A0A2H3AZN7_9AGAR|nr:hypothetical protein ARMSODRAFT_805682 [Armillaria solidipes]
MHAGLPLAISSLSAGPEFRCHGTDVQIQRSSQVRTPTLCFIFPALIFPSYVRAVFDTAEEMLWSQEEKNILLWSLPSPTLRMLLPIVSSINEFGLVLHTWPCLTSLSASLPPMCETIDTRTRLTNLDGDTLPFYCEEIFGAYLLVVESMSGSDRWFRRMHCSTIHGCRLAPVAVQVGTRLVQILLFR